MLLLTIIPGVGELLGLTLASEIGDVARLLVLSEQADERAAEIHVQCREDEWERRLGDTRVRRKVVRERTEAVARGESVDEAGERGDCVVHAAGGIRIPPGDRSRVWH